MTPDERVRGKAALDKLMKRDEELDSVEQKQVLQELHAIYRDPPLNGYNLGAELHCSPDGWTVTYPTGNNYLHRMHARWGSCFPDAEGALESLARYVLRLRGKAYEEEGVGE